MNFTFNEPVLVRNHKDEKWNLNYFERYVENDYYPFKMNDETFYRQCIPYVGNEDLCYTTLEPKTLRLSKKITHYRPCSCTAAVLKHPFCGLPLCIA